MRPGFLNCAEQFFPNSKVYSKKEPLRLMKIYIYAKTKNVVSMLVQ